MPFYEFFCDNCRKRETFHARRPTMEIPPCPHCGGELSREIPSFSIGSRPAANEDADWLGATGVDETRAASAAASMNPLLDTAWKHDGNHASADAARAVQQYAEAAGIALGDEARELVQAIASGRNAETSAAAFQEFLDSGGKPFADAKSDRNSQDRPQSGKTSHSEGFPIDPELHEMPENLLPPLPKRKPGPWDDPF